MKVTAIVATCGRHYCSEHSLSLFLKQDYNNDKQLLIFQNSNVSQELSPTVNPNIVKMVNNHIDYTTKKPYTSLGTIYNDALKHIPSDTDLITFWDDDDIFFENHVSEGVKEFIKGGRKAYKPLWSFYRDYSGVRKAQNTFEPSIFVESSHLFNYGFSNTISDQHLK